MTQFPTSPVTESALSVMIKQYAVDLRRNASGGDDYPYEFAKGVADYLGVLIKRAKGNCACAQNGFPDSCDNCDAFGHAPCLDLEPVAYLHTLHMELGQTQRKLMWTEPSPFGIPGKHYSAEYTVSCTPLFASPDSSTDRAKDDDIRALNEEIERMRAAISSPVRTDGADDLEHLDGMLDDRERG